MLFIKLGNGLLREFRHLKLGNFETVGRDTVKDLAEVLVGVGLDHGECSGAGLFETVTGANIAVVGDFHHTREECDFSAEIEVFKAESGDLHLFEEDAGVLDVVHLNHVAGGEVVEGVLADNGSLLIVPVQVEDKAFF